MAQTTLLGIQDSSNYSGPGGYRQKITITLADFQNMGAVLTGDILLMNLPPRSIARLVMTKHSVALTGTGPLTAATVVVKTANNATLGGAAFNVFQAVADSTSQLTIPAALKENYATATPLLAGVVLTGGNANVLLTGSVDIWVTYEVLV